MAPTTVGKYVRYAAAVLWILAGGWMVGATAGEWRMLPMVLSSSGVEHLPASFAVAWGGWLVMGLALWVWHLRAAGSARESAQVRAAMRWRQQASARLASAKGRAGKRSLTAAFGELEERTEPAPAIGALSRRPGD